MRMDELIPVFNSEVDRHFEFLVSDHQAKHSWGLCTPGDELSALNSEKPIPVTAFLYANRFSLKKLILDICYGEREAIVSMEIRYLSLAQTLSFCPSELLRANGIIDETRLQSVRPKPWIHTEESMRDTISSLAHGLAKEWSLIEIPGPDIGNRILSIRHDDRVNAQNKQRSMDREAACIKGGYLFHQARYKDVLRILGPFEADPDLPSASKKLFELARKHLADKCE